MMFDYDVLIIGNGAAGYAVADRLCEKGIKNICIVTQDRNLSTSRCSGSDKQTYYKLDIASPEGDSIEKMALDLFNGGSMNGSDAYLEAANSLPCFMHLCEIGVPFPQDEYGIYQGYRTDHDNTKRATSCGPLTSKYMTEKLEQRVECTGVEVLDNHQVIRLAVNNGRCFGAYCLTDNKTRLILARNTVLCTGAPSSVYADSVYPEGHTGATGLAIEAGARLSNFQEWQYGIASKKFRWNLSGSYQQVIPRYISIDTDGNETEFLEGIEDIFTKIFLKGYEWPFNSKRIEGSSLVDILVMNEISKGCSVYLDYTKNPNGFDFGLLGDEAYDYLKKAGVDAATPYERLLQLNPKAAKLYYDNGIDLSKDKLLIGVCSQHNNGGIMVDANGETSVHGLFCAGEASGRFGVYRPGGAALNDTQVGALLISRYIAGQNSYITDIPDFGEIRLPSLSDNSNIEETDMQFGRRMSDYAGAKRDSSELEKLIADLSHLAEDFRCEAKISSEEEYGRWFSFYHTTLARLSLCITVLASLHSVGSRGGCMCTENGSILPENEEMRNYITVTSGREVTFSMVDKIPVNDCAFEKLLRT